MDYGTVLSKFSACMTEIGNALRKINGTTKKYKFTEIASAINECTQVYYLGTGTSFDVSNIPDYQNLTVDNFLVVADTVTINGTFFNNGYDSSYYCGNANTANASKTYNSSSGIFSCSNSVNTRYYPGQSANGDYYNTVSASFSPKVYLVKGKIKTM